MLKGYTIQSVNKEGMFWFLPPILMTQLNIRENQPVTLDCGSRSALVKVVPLDSSKLENRAGMGLSKDALGQLLIPEHVSLSIKPLTNQHFRLGPVIGILTFPHVFINRKFGWYKSFARMMKHIGLIYVSRGKEVNPQAMTIKGYYYNYESKTWEPGEFGYPDAVIDFSYPNSYWAHLHIEKVIGQGKIFNKKTMINKYDFYEALYSDENLRNHLPETRMLIQAADLEYFFKKYDSVFLKPLNGMKGRGIITASPVKDGLLCRYTIDRNVVTETIPTPDQIFEVIERASEHKRPYVVQNALPRMEYQGRSVAFRVMTAKNGNGQWLVPAIFAKGTTGAGFLTNLSAGAKVVFLQDLFSEIDRVLPGSQIELLTNLVDLALRTAKTLDAKFGPLGKLGIDVIIDPSGKLWLLEANGNPGGISKHNQIEFPDWAEQLYEYPLAYAIYLAGFFD